MICCCRFCYCRCSSVSLSLLTQIQCYFHISIPITHLSPSRLVVVVIGCCYAVRRLFFYIFFLLNIIQNVTCFCFKWLKVNSTLCLTVPDYRIARCVRVCVTLFICLSVDRSVGRSNVCQASVVAWGGCMYVCVCVIAGEYSLAHSNNANAYSINCIRTASFVWLQCHLF